MTATILALYLALTCADGTCDAEDWLPMPPAVEALDADECPSDDPACADFDEGPPPADACRTW